MQSLHLTLIRIITIFLLFLTDSEGKFTKRIEILNDLIDAAARPRPVDTIAYFGLEEEIALYVHHVKPEIPSLVITKNYKYKTLRLYRKNGFSTNIFFIAFGSLKDYKSWRHLREAFKYMQHRMRGVFIADKPFTDSHELFSWCWRNGYVDVMALMQHEDDFEAVCYTPFPHVQVFEVTPFEPRNISCFENNFNDLRGYKMRTAVQYDPPRVFRVPLRKHNFQSGSEIKGYTGVMFQEFLNRHNSVLEIVRRQNNNHSNENILGIIRQLNEGNIDMSMNPYFPYRGVRISYPLRMMHWCILTPSSHVLHPYQYFLRPFQGSMWLGCTCILFYFALIWSLVTYVRQLRNRGYGRWHFIRHLTETFRLMIYQPMPAYRGHLHWTYACIFSLVVLVGFILTNVYLALLTSYLTKVIFQPQLNMLAEIVAHNLSINIIAHELPIILKNRGLPNGFTDLLKPRNATHMVNDILALNKIDAFAAREDLMHFSLVQQAFQLRPRFHVAQEYIATVPVGYLMPSHSQFEGSLNNFILHASAAGLIDKWFQDTIHDGFTSGILRLRRDRIEHALPLTLDHFQFSWFVLICGFSLAGIAFAFENTFRIRCRLKCKVWRRR